MAVVPYNPVNYRADIAYLAETCEPVFCLYCARSAAPPFISANQAALDVFGGRSVEALIREHVIVNLAEDRPIPRPEAWLNDYMPAAAAYRVWSADGSSSICVAGFGTEKKTYERARSLVVAAVGIVQQRMPRYHYLQADPIFSSIIDGIERMTSPISLWDDDCWFASKAELRGYCARLAGVPRLRITSLNQRFTKDEVKDVLESSKLDPEELRRIWQLFDYGIRTLQELLCAMAIAARRRKGMHLPPELPLDIYMAAGEVVSSVDCLDSATSTVSAASTSAGLSDVALEQAQEESSSDGEEEDEEEPRQEPSHAAAWERRNENTVTLPDYPWVADCKTWLAETSLQATCPRFNADSTWIPIMCLRWTHDGIQGNLAFKDRSPVIRLVLDMWQRRYTYSLDVPALDVVLENGDLWCLSNRRLAAFRMLQALSAETVWAECKVHGPEHRKYRLAKTTKNRGVGVAPNYIVPIGASSRRR